MSPDLSSSSALLYIDHNASTPLCAAAREAIIAAMQWGYANPSALHQPGRQARAMVELAREQVALAIAAKPEDIIFTSGGTESLNHILFGVSAMHPGCAIAISAVEHPAVSTPADDLQRRGHSLTRIPVNDQGVVDVDAWQPQADTRLLMLMHANNETGAIQPVAAMSQRAHAHGALLGCDAAQSLGKIPVDVHSLDCDFLTIAGHKFGAPKGIGALWIRPGLTLPALIRGAGHERGLRAGSENVLLIAALGAACADLQQRLQDMPRLQHMRDSIELHLQQRQHAVVHAARAPRLPNTSLVALPGMNAAALLAHLPDVAASTGSACHAGQHHASPTLQAMAVDTALAQSTLRLSLGPENSDDDGDVLLQRIEQALELHPCR